MTEPIFVTRPYLPPLDELLPLLEGIWERRWLSNHGPLHQQFERALGEFLGADHVSLTANGMLGLESAISASDLDGEVITTPYSFVATPHAIRRAGLTPVFVDIRPADLNIDPSLIERSITVKTSAIVAVHCYGNPCDHEAIHAIADRHQLKVIYDAAHAFGVRQGGQSVAARGDFSVLSFHATKTFNTFEGGAVLAKTASDRAKINSLVNFGIADEVTVVALGGNAKMNEFAAAMGLIQLRHFTESREGRRRVDARYREALSDVAGIDLLPIAPDVDPNYSYFPVLVTEEYPLSRDELYEAMKAEQIFARRYFYPLLSNLPMYQGLTSAQEHNLPVANRAANQVLCLPIYHDLPQDAQDRIIEIVRR
jgi:dTDP-4-amino-4,6-dideoxygalactose transaminase